MSDSNLNPSQNPKPETPRSAWPLAVTLVIGILAATYAYVHTVNKGAEGLHEVRQALASLNETKLTTIFSSHLSRMSAETGGKLIVGSLEQVESFRQSSERKTLWGLLNLGTTVTEIRVPATYQYFINLSDPWTLRIRDRNCVAMAPRIRPNWPVAFLTSGMEKYENQGWLRFNVKEQMAAMEKELSTCLFDLAGSTQYVENVRDKCRLSVAQFVETWLLRDRAWGEDGFNAITVVFADEAHVEDRQPTLSITKN